MWEVVKSIPVDRNAVSSKILSDHARRSDLNYVAEDRARFFVKGSRCQRDVACIVWTAQSWIVGIQVDQCRDGVVWKPLGSEESTSYDCVSETAVRNDKERSSPHKLGPRAVPSS